MEILVCKWIKGEDLKSKTSVGSKLKVAELITPEEQTVLENMNPVNVLICDIKRVSAVEHESSETWTCSPFKL